jgi:hypothetical protein
METPPPKTPSDNNPMHPSGEVGRFRMDNLSSPPGDCGRSAKEIIS